MTTQRIGQLEQVFQTLGTVTNPFLSPVFFLVNKILKIVCLGSNQMQYFLSTIIFFENTFRKTKRK